MKRDSSITWVMKAVLAALVIPGLAGTVANGEVTLNYQVSAGYDDGYTFETNHWVLLEWLYIGHYDNTTDVPYAMAGMRFQDVSIPEGAIIVDARLKLRAYSPQYIGNGWMYSVIEAEDRDNPPDFSVTRIDERPKTSAGVNWDLQDMAYPPYYTLYPNKWYESPDISSVIQEVIDRPGWTPGNAMVIFCSCRLNDRSYCSFHSYEGSASSAPELEITLAIHTISGYIERPNGTAIEGVSVTVDGESYSAVTDSSGYYELEVPQLQGGWSGTTRASKAPWSFQPESYSYTNVTGDLSDQNFTAIGVIISGYTTETWGEGVEGVLVSADGNGGSDTSNGDGYYELVVPLDWSGTVTPSKPNRTFVPPNRSYSNLNTDISGQDFVAERIWAYGSGTAGDPYLIYTPEDMNNIGANPDSWDKHFKLMADIDLGPYTGTAFNTIGISSQRSFMGVFDGNGKTISNFTYNRTGMNFNGLFRSVGTYGPDAGKGEIKNLGLIDPNVNAGTGYDVGALVGSCWFGTITGCYVEGGSVSGDRYVGGLAGYAEGDIIDCHSSASINGNDFVGGLVGMYAVEMYMLSFTLTNCYATGIVSGNNYVGGLVGQFGFGTISSSYSSGSVVGTGDYIGGLVGAGEAYGPGPGTGTISDCYANGGVSGNDGVGGLLGYNLNLSSVAHCYSSGSVSGNSNIGGLVGNDDSGFYTTCFWDNRVNPSLTGIGNGADPNVIGRSTTNMKKASTFTSAGWDFVGESDNGTEDIWTILEGRDYPRLSWEKCQVVKRENVCLIMNGSFENDGVIYSITDEDTPQYWCDVNIPSTNFGGWVDDTYWSTHYAHSLTLYSEMFATFAAGDMATVSQKVYLMDVNEIIFDLNLNTIWGPELWDRYRSAVLLIDGNILWDSNSILGPDANGLYLDQIVDVNQIYKDANSHILSLGIRANVSEYSINQYWVQWDFVKFDTYCGGFGYLPEDLNRDCYVNILDLEILAGQWLAEEPPYNCDLLADDESITNLRDFAKFATYWQDSACQPSNGCGGCDFDGSRTVDSADLMIFAEYWLEPIITLSDLNTDRVINFKDVAIFAGRWQDNTDWINWQDDNCYEMELLAGDTDDSGEVYYGDILMLADNWLSVGKCIRADINKDGVVNFIDFAIISDEWLLKNWLYGLK